MFFSSPSILFTALVAMTCSIKIVDASIAYDPTLTCQVQVIKGASQRICATSTMFGPSPAVFPNGTSVLQGPTGYDFEFWKGLAAGTDTTSSDVDIDKHKLGYTVGVSWENGACEVTVAGTQCSSCSLCSESEDDQAMTTLSADCTNIEGGRKATCEKAFIFFPLKQSKRFNHGIGKKPSAQQMGMMKKSGLRK